MFGLTTFDAMPLIYGIVIFLGLYSMWRKLVTFRWLSLFVEIFVFVLVFRLHGGTMAGGFAATIAALLSGIIMPRSLKH